MGAAFAKHPKYFDKFYCNLISAGEAGGVLEHLLDKLAVSKKKLSPSRKKLIGSYLSYSRCCSGGYIGYCNDDVCLACIW